MNKLLFLLIFSLTSYAVFSQGLTIRNDASRTQRRGYYNWRIYLDGNRDSLRQIQEVTYTLHPSYPNPVQTVSYSQSNIFEYRASGWGEFDVKVKIVYSDRRRYPLYLVHHLNLSVN